MYSRRPFTFDRVIRIVITCVVIAGALALINILKSVLLPFCVACLVAYLLEPFVQFNRKLLKLQGRVIAVFVTLFEATFFFGILCYFLIPMIMDEMRHMGYLVKLYSTIEHNVPLLPENIQPLIRKYIDLDYIANMMSDEQQLRILENFVTSTWNLLSSGISMIIGLLSWCIVFLYVIFIMLDYERLVRTVRGMIPSMYRHMVFKIGHDIQRSMNHYFRGQALVAFCVGILFCIGFLIIDLPLAVVLGMFIGLLNMVPYLQLISIIPTTLLCVVCSVDSGIDFWTIFLECMAVYAIVQLIQDLFLTPKIMGKAMGLNPAIILLSLSVWGTLLGFLGLIIALPLTTLLLGYYDEYLTFLQRRRRTHSGV